MLPDRKSFLFRYGIAILAIAILLLLSFGLRSLGIQLNLTAPIVIAIVAVSWFGGRGPGIVVSIVIVGIAMLSRMAAEPATCRTGRCSTSPASGRWWTRWAG